MQAQPQRHLFAHVGSEKRHKKQKQFKCSSCYVLMLPNYVDAAYCWSTLRSLTASVVHAAA